MHNFEAAENPIMEKLNLFGIGPKMGRIILPWLAVTIIITIIWPQCFWFVHPQPWWLLIIGIVILVAGLLLWMISGKMIVSLKNEPRLLTTGPYALCRNPLYLSMIMFVIPSIALIMNSLLVLTTSVVGYVMFRICISQECDEMHRIFGDEYEKYCRKTPEFFPFPFLGNGSEKAN